MEGERFKTRGDVLAFAARHPGALSANFLRLCHQKLTNGRVSSTRQLREVSTTAWAQLHAGVSDVRDQKEVMTLCAALDSINNRDLATAMDIISQRVLSIQTAKMKGGFWEKANKLELVSDPGASSLAGGFLRLTNS